MSDQFSTAVVHSRVAPIGASASVQFRELSAVEMSVFAARFRLAEAVRQNERLKTIEANGKYYGSPVRSEETIHDAMCRPELGALVTRNHYGSLVLNAARALFIDVDVPGEERDSPSCGVRPEHLQGPWRQTLDDLRLVLANESNDGFRIYRTAAGFRILSTSREFDSGSRAVAQLMRAVGADRTFMRLCVLQKCFRARLTPKPWRCGAEKPPHSFPRQSAVEEQCFARWLDNYDHACRDLATCQFLDHVGPAAVCDAVAPIVELHDRLTKVGEQLALA